MADVARDSWQACTNEMGDVLGVPAKSNCREGDIRKRHAERPNQRQCNKVDDDEAVAFSGDASAGVSEDKRAKKSEGHHHPKQVRDDNRQLETDDGRQEVAADEIQQGREAAGCKKAYKFEY